MPDFPCRKSKNYKLWQISGAKKQKLITFGSKFLKKTGISKNPLIFNFWEYCKTSKAILLQQNASGTKRNYNIQKDIFNPEYINPLEKEWGIGQVQSIIKNKATINFQNVGKQVVNLDNIKLEKVHNEQK